MAKKVLVVSTSLRGNSNSEILAKECERGAKDAGHEVEFVSLRGKDIRFCIGCMTCQKTGHCVLKDDVAEIMEKVKESEVIIFATPIYYYEMCGQMKTLLDRLNPLYESEYKFRDIYMLATCSPLLLMTMRTPSTKPTMVCRVGSIALRKPNSKAMCSAAALLNREMQRTTLRLSWMSIISESLCEA